MQALSLKQPTKQICSVHCWQHMKVSAMFEYEPTGVVSLSTFLQFFRSKFTNIFHFSGECSVKVYYLSNLESWDERLKIEDDETLRSRLISVFDDKSLKSYIMVSIEDQSPTKPPVNDDASSSKVSVLTSYSRGSVQSNFHQRVLSRDECRCVFCGDSVKANLNAAHIFDVSRAADIPAGDSEFLRQFEIIDIYDTLNGITLCSECHLAFDALLCCVKVTIGADGATDHVIEVANALKLCPDYTTKWSQLDGAKLRVPTSPVLLRQWPPVALFQFRKEKYDEHTVARHRLAEDHPTVCSSCGKRTKSLSGLSIHMKSKSCLEHMTSKSNKFSMLHTPGVKEPAGDKKQKKLSKKKGEQKKSAADKTLFSPDSKS